MQTAAKECRQAPREHLSEPVRVRPCDPQYPEEVCTSLNVSRNGVYLVTSAQHYFVGMNLVLTLNFDPNDSMQREQIGDVVRVDQIEERVWGIAIRILIHNNPGIYSGT